MGKEERVESGKNSGKVAAETATGKLRNEKGENSGFCKGLRDTPVGIHGDFEVW